MSSRERLPSVQVPGHLPGQPLRVGPETNIRLIDGSAIAGVTCRRVEVRCAVRSAELRASVCSKLRHRHEILVLGVKKLPVDQVRDKLWRAELHDLDRNVRLRPESEDDQQVFADLLERCLVVAFEQSAGYWRLSRPLRNWYDDQPVARVDGVEIIPRISFSTVRLGEPGVGIAFDTGYLNRTERTVAEFFDPNLGPGERNRRRREFDRFRNRAERRQGTLLYTTGEQVVPVCYFERFAEGVTCGTTGPVVQHDSLYDYCQERYPKLDLEPSDLVAYVSFPGLPHPVPVPAKWLRLRVMIDEEQSHRGLGKYKTLPPENRRDAAIRGWDRCQAVVERLMRCEAEAELWTPPEERCELLPCPDLQFGGGRVVVAPRQATTAEYGRYYRERLEKLKSGGLYHYAPAVERKLLMVTPKSGNGWTDELQTAFIADFGKVLQDITGSRFSLTQVREDDPERVVEVLDKITDAQGGTGTTVIVFDDRLANGASYYLLSHGLKGWHLKRLTRGQVVRKWEARRSGRNPEDRNKADRRWLDMVTLSVLDTLDQMEAIPWRIVEWPYEACLAIDVGEGRRHFAMSLLVCRGSDQVPSFARISDSWPKGDHQHETINPVILRDKVVQLFDSYEDSGFAPIRSLLVLRDGRLCGQEQAALVEAIDRLPQKDRLAQEVTADFAEVHKKTVKNLRMWLPQGRGHVNVLEGQAIYLDGEAALLTCTGAATLSRAATADPCLLILKRGRDVRRAARAFFALSQLNYSSPTKAQRYAHPIRETDSRLQQRMAEDMRGVK
ncbi:MAG: hypothetical protein HY000_22995 [Planctomycetes bacterium]|nr:hypothetical protein [Planctomycetota bacterium]